VGDISWPEHVAIFTTPFKAAIDLGIALIFYGENPQNQYGGPPGTEQAREMTRRWVSEFGGFLGLRPADLLYHISPTDMKDYLPPSAEDLDVHGVEAHFLGQYIAWDSYRNATIALKAGMRTCPISPANFWPWENLDNAQTGIHDHQMYRKYGYGRGCAQISVDVRAGLLSREFALKWVSENDGKLAEVYAGVPLQDVLVRLDMTQTEFNQLLDQFTNWDIMHRVVDDSNATPILI
jgi:hypothetical protein